MNGTYHKKAKKDYWNDPIMAAKRIAYKDIYIPKGIEDKVKVYIKKNGEVAIKWIGKMKKITEKNLLKLGFQRQDETSSPLETFHYYTYEIQDKCLLISCSNDEVNDDGGYTVEFYEMPDLKILKLEHLKKLIDLLETLENG